MIVLGTAHADERRIVSIDHCADLHVLAFAPRGEIVAVSKGARGDFAYLRDQAEGIRSVEAEIEAVLALRPTLIVRSYGGDARFQAFLERSGVEVLNVGFPATPEEIRQNTARMAAALGGTPPVVESPPHVTERGERVLYLTPSGVTAGRGTLTSQLIEEAGFENYETRQGWHELPLERLVTQKPDRLVTAFFGSANRFEGWWDTLRHPRAAELLDELPRTDLPGDLLACAAFPALTVPARLMEAR